MISADDVRADVKKQEMQELEAVSCKFLYKYIATFKAWNMYFLFNFAGYSMQFEIVRWEQGRVSEIDFKWCTI